MSSPTSSPSQPQATATRPTPTLIPDTPLPSSLSHQSAQYQDCASCRVMGSAVFTGLGFYTLYSGRKQLREREVEILRSGSRFGVMGRRMMVYVMSAGLVGLGAWRMVE